TDATLTLCAMTQHTGSGVFLFAQRHRRFQTGERGQIRTAGSLFFLFGNPAIKLFLGHNMYFDRHEGVVFATQFGALTVINASRIFRHHGPGFVNETGDGILLDSKVRHKEGVNHVIRGDQEAHLDASRQHQRLVHRQHIVVIFFLRLGAKTVSRGAVGEQTVLQYRRVVLLCRGLQVGEKEYANVVVVLIGQVLVAPVPAVAGDLDGQLGLGAVIHGNQYPGSRDSHKDQDDERNHCPGNFHTHVLVESRRLGTLAAAVGHGGVHDQTEYAQADHRDNPEDCNVQTEDVLTDVGDPGTEVDVGPFGPVAGDTNTTDQQQCERGGHATEQC